MRIHRKAVPDGTWLMTMNIHPEEAAILDAILNRVDFPHPLLDTFVTPLQRQLRAIYGPAYIDEIPVVIWGANDYELSGSIEFWGN